MSPDQVTQVEKLCKSYLAAMESSDLQALLANFTDHAIAKSPIFGKMPVREFYAKVMRITSDRSMALKTIFIGASDPLRAAVHVSYTRTVGNGKLSTIEAVDVFELAEDLSKFTAITIIYDTAPVLSDFNKLESDSGNAECKRSH